MGQHAGAPLFVPGVCAGIPDPPGGTPRVVFVRLGPGGLGRLLPKREVSGAGGESRKSKVESRKSKSNLRAIVNVNVNVNCVHKPILYHEKIFSQRISW